MKRFKNLIINFLIHPLSIIIVVFLLSLGILATTPSFPLQVNNADGLLVQQTDKESPIHVTELQVDKIGVPEGTDLEVQAIISNYDNNVKEDVKVFPRLYDVNGNYVEDRYSLTTKISSFNIQPGKTKVLRYEIDQFERSNNNNLTLVLESDTHDLSSEPKKNINILPNGSNSIESSITDRDPTTINEFSPYAFKDQLAEKREQPLSSVNIPPVDKDDTNGKFEYDVANGIFENFGTILDPSTGRAAIRSDNGINIGLAYKGIPDSKHYMLSFRQGPTSSNSDLSDNDVEIRIVNSIGEEVDTNTTYHIPPAEYNTGQTVNYRMSKTEMNYVRSKGELYVEIYTNKSSVDITNIRSINVKSSQEIDNLPESRLDVENVKVDGLDPTSNKLSYNLNQRFNVSYKVSNVGNAGFDKKIKLFESNVLGTIRASNDIIINPGSTRKINFTINANPKGTHIYSLFDENVKVSNNKNFGVTVGDIERKIFPSIITNKSNLFIGESAKFELAGIFEEDKEQRIKNVTWSFDDQSTVIENNDSNAYMKQIYEFSEKEAGDNFPISVQIRYKKGDKIDVVEDQISVDVISSPEPRIKTIYYDVIVGNRLENPRRGASQLDNIDRIQGTLVSKPCTSECKGSIDLSIADPESLGGGLDFIAIKNDFANRSLDPIHYSTYDFNNDKYAQLNDSWKDIGQNQIKEDDAVSSFEENIQKYSKISDYIILVGTGNPNIDEDVESAIENNLGGVKIKDVTENDSYTIVTEFRDSNHKPLHESYHPSESHQGLEHDLSIEPFESDSIPPDRPVYITVKGSSGSDFYRQNEAIIEYNINQGNVQYTGSNNQVDAKWISKGTGTYDLSATVESYSNDIVEQESRPSDEIELEVSSEPPVAEAEKYVNNVKGEKVVLISASESYNIDGQIESEYNWKIKEGSDLVSDIQVLDNEISSPHFILKNSEDTSSNLFKAELEIKGNKDDIVFRFDDAKPKFDIQKVSAGYNNPINSDQTVFYSFGNNRNDIGLSKKNLEEFLKEEENVSDLFGEGKIEKRSNHVFVEADADLGSSASRFVETTRKVDFSKYDRIYLSYDRLFSRNKEDGSPETGYVSMHIGDIDRNEFTFGQEGTLRGTEVPFKMTSDVVTGDTTSRRGDILKLDVSDVEREDKIIIHTRAHGSNLGNSKVRIYEMWGAKDTSNDPSDIFDNNFYPENIAGSTVSDSLSGYMITGNSSLSSEPDIISARPLESENITIRYSIGESTNSSSIIASKNNYEFPPYDNSISGLESKDVKISYENEKFGDHYLSDRMTIIDDSKNNKPSTILVSADESLEGSNLQWSAENAKVEDPNSLKTEINFLRRGEHNIKLETENGLSLTKSVEVDSIGPDVSVGIPDKVSVGSTINVQPSVEPDRDKNIEKVKIILDDGRVVEQTEENIGQTFNHTYQNPGVYNVIVVAKDSDELTSATSSRIVVDEQSSILSTDNLQYTVNLPSDVIFDPNPPQEESYNRPIKYISLSSILELNPENLDFTWNSNDQTKNTEEYLHTTKDSGVTIINMTARHIQSNIEETVSIKLTKKETKGPIADFNIEPEQGDKLTVNNGAVFDGSVSSPGPEASTIEKYSWTINERRLEGKTIDVNFSNVYPESIEVKLKVTNNIGQSNTTSKNIEVASDINAELNANISGDTTIKAFKEVGDYSWNVPKGVDVVDVLVVGGGGGGGRSLNTMYQSGGGGGGSGGIVFKNNYEIQGENINIIVGDGGSPGNRGENSSFGELKAIGGGAGADEDGNDGIVGGSGGGGVLDFDGGRSIQYSQKNGFGSNGGNSSNKSGAGGGGAFNGVEKDSISGGRGLYFGHIFSENYGSNGWFGGGGGGGKYSMIYPGLPVMGGEGGKGGGGKGGGIYRDIIPPEDGQENTGGGGGGGSVLFNMGSSGGSGGSGIVIVRYLDPNLIEFNASESTTTGENNEIVDYKYDYTDNGNYNLNSSDPVSTGTPNFTKSLKVNLTIFDKKGYKDSITKTFTLNDSNQLEDVRPKLKIENWEHLNDVRNNTDINYELMNNLNEQTEGYNKYVKEPEGGFRPIGDLTFDPDRYNFNGNYNTISGLRIQGKDSYGLFSSNNGTIKNLELKDAIINSSNLVSGSIVGLNIGKIENVSVTGNSEVIGDGKTIPGVGGLVGLSLGGQIIKSHSEAYVESSKSSQGTGGLLGYGFNVSIDRSFSTGDVLGYNRTGGLVGSIDQPSEIRRSFAKGDVEGNARVGGLIGHNSNANISKTYSIGNITGTYSSGGLIGKYGSPSSSDSLSLQDSYVLNTQLDNENKVVGEFYPRSPLSIEHSDTDLVDKNDIEIPLEEQEINRLEEDLIDKFVVEQLDKIEGDSARDTMEVFDFNNIWETSINDTPKIN